MTVITVTQGPGDRRRTVACHGTPLLTVVVTLVMVVMVVTLLTVVMMVTLVMVWRVQGRGLPAM